MVTFLSLFTLLCLSAGVSAAPSLPTDCPEREIQMDKCVGYLLLITDPDAKVVKNTRELEESYCRNVNKWMRCLAEYKPCLKAFERQIFSLIMNNSKKNTKAICSTKDKKEEYVKNISCFTKQTLAELRKVTFKITSAIEYVSGLDDLDEMIPGLCCGIHEVLKMGSDVVDKMCSNQTGQQTTQYFMGMLSSALSDSLDLVCGSYDSISTCQRKKPQVLESLRVKLAEDVSFNYTAIIPMMQVIKKLDSDI